MTHPIDLAQKFSLFSEPWQPKIVGEVNGMHVKLARLQGEFEWHSHEKEDELFFVVEGVLIMKFRDRTERITPGQFIICLLYTSPSPRDQRGSRMPSSA